MPIALFVAGFPPETTDDQLRAVFETAGEVQQVERLDDMVVDGPLGRAVVTLETEQVLDSLLTQFNGCELGEQRLAVSPDEPPKKPKKPTAEHRALAKAVIEQLEETGEWGKRGILRVVHRCGPAFTEVLVDKVLSIEAQGGMLVSDGSRRRTPGGVFFYLMKRYVSRAMAAAIFPRPKKKKKGPPVQKTAEAPAPATTIEKEEPPDEVIQARAQIEELQQALKVAETQLDAVKTGRAGKPISPMVLMKQVVNLRQQLDTLRSQYPDRG